MTDTALVVIDVQRGFDDPSQPPRNNPAAETNIKALLDAWAAARQPVVLVRHESSDPSSPLAKGAPGVEFKAELDGVDAAVVITKNVHSAFHGTPDLHEWLQHRGISRLVLAGIMTNWCVETTARVGGNLGYEVTVALDATHTFDGTGHDGTVLTADELARATAVNLHAGGFATVSSTAEVLNAAYASRAARTAS